MATVWKKMLVDGGDAGTPSAIVLTNATQIPSASLTGTIADARMPDLTGDVTTSAGAVATTIASDAVSYDKMQDLGTANRVLGSTSTGTIGEVQIATAMIANDAVTLAKLDGVPRGKLITGDSSGDPTALAPGTNGQVLTSDGTDISWGDAASGDVTGVTAGVGLSGGGSSGALTLTLDLTELTADTDALVAGDQFIMIDGGVQGKMACSEINLGVFDNDQGWTSNTGDITGVTIVTDSGSGSKMADTAGSADFTLLGATGCGVTNSGNTATVTAVPGEIGITALSGYSAGAYANASSVGASGIVTVGTIGTGVWQGTTIKTAYIGDDQVTEAKLADTLLAEIDANTAKSTNVSSTGSYADGTTSGPVLTFDGSSTVTIPAASALVSGVVVTGPQDLPGNFTVTGNLAVNGDFTVSGSNTVILAEELKVEDNTIVLNSNWDSGTAPSQDCGLTVERGSSDDESFFWDESTDQWSTGHTESSNVFTPKGVMCTAVAQTYSSTQTNVHGAFSIGSFQIDSGTIYMRVS